MEWAPAKIYDINPYNNRPPPAISKYELKVLYQPPLGSTCPWEYCSRERTAIENKRHINHLKICIVK